MHEFKISLEAARINARLTQKKASALIGVSNKTLCAWEKGTSYPRADKIPVICSVYGIPYDCLNFLIKNPQKADN